VQTADDLKSVARTGASQGLVDASLHGRALDAVHPRAVARRTSDGDPENCEDVAARQVAKDRQIGQPAAQEHVVIG
jgi:hypothetical protein